MNRKQFIILLVLVAVIGAAGLWVRQSNKESWQSSETAIGQKLLPGLPVNDITQITIKSGTSELSLAKRDNLWRVRERGDYPANFSQISELLIKLADLKVAQSEEIGQSQLGRFELLPTGPGPNTATAVEFKDQNGKLLNGIMLGKKHMKKPAGNNAQLAGMGDEGWPDGRYVMTGSGLKKLLVVSDPLDNLQPKPDQWLNKDFLSIEKPRSVAVEFPEATNSWKLTRASETNDWQLANAKAGEKLDSSKTSSVTSPFGSPTFNDVAAGSASTTNNTVLTVETFDGFNYVAKIAPKQNENYPVSFAITASLPTERPAAKEEKAEEKAKLDKEFKDRQTKLGEKLAKEKALANWVYQMPAYSVDEILKPRQQLLVEPSTNAPAETQK